MADRDDENSCGDHDTGPSRPTRKPGKACIRCNQAPATYLFRGTDPVCWPCLKGILISRARTTLIRSRPVSSEVIKAVIAFSGSAAGSVLMDIVHGLSQRMRMETHVAFVDTGSYFGITSSERQTVHAAVQAIAAKFNFPCSILPLEDVFVDIPAAEDRRTKLNELINSGTTLTAKEDILSSVIRLRVIQQAKELKYSRVLLTQTSTEMAINVISGCAKGRGHQLAAEVATVARLPDEGISIVQPFKDILLAETEYYFHMERLSHVKTPHISGVLQKHLSINRLTEDFILGLQGDFPQTVHTVIRTGDKLVSQFGADQAATCPVCMFVVKKDELVPEQHGMCYSCAQLNKETSRPTAGEASPLELYAKSTKRRLLTREEMLAQIAEFTLADDDENDSADSHNNAGAQET